MCSKTEFPVKMNVTAQHRSVCVCNSYSNLRFQNYVVNFKSLELVRYNLMKNTHYFHYTFLNLLTNYQYTITVVTGMRFWPSVLKFCVRDWLEVY
jgi:hypothetical protein